MLKSTFKKVSAIAIAGTMLAGMMAVPANAMRQEIVYGPKTIHVIDENFQSYDEATYTVNDTNNLQSFIPGNNRIQYCRENPHQDGTAGIAKDGDNKVLTAGYVQGFKLNFDAAEPAQVKEGDIVKISFRFKYNISKKCRFLVNLNDATPRFSFISSTNSTADNNGSPNWASTTNPRIMSILPGDNKIAVSDSWGHGMNGMNNDTWYTVTATINTKDSAYENKQTLKIQCGSWWMIGEFDANYTGEDDTTYDLLTNVDSLQIDTYTWTADDGVFKIDDLKIDVTGDREVVDYVTDLSKTLVNEDFSGLNSTAATHNPYNGTTKDDKKTLEGTSFQYCTYGNEGWTAGKYPTETTTEKALKVVGQDHHYALFVNTAPTRLVPGDIINMSYDCYQDKDNYMYVMLQGLQDKGVRYKSISANNYYQGSVSNEWVSVSDSSKAQSTADNVATIAITGSSRDTENEKPTMLAPVYAHSGGNNAQYTFTPGRWYTIEISINTKDPAHGNKQTMTLRYKERGTDAYLQEYVGYLDTDKTNDTSGDVIDALTTFNGFDIALHTYNNSNGTTYIDNVKAEIVKPGFEVVDVDNSTNTYTFSGTAQIELNYLTNASAASKVIVAQYDNTGRMIKAEPADVDASGRGTVTVEPDANANMIKLMVIDTSTAIPYAKVFKLTKSN